MVDLDINRVPHSRLVQHINSASWSRAAAGRKVWTLISVVAMLLAIGLRATVDGQAVSTSVWDGVFTNEQAVRGATFYEKECASCHGDSLRGEGDASALVGAGFLATWGGQTVADLFEQTRKSMPKDNANTFSRQQYADVVAFVLRANAFPAGTVELPRDTAPLGRIRIDVFRPSSK